MKLYGLILLFAVACAGCVAILPSDGVTVFDCARWERGRTVPTDIAKVCAERDHAKRVRYD